MSVLAEVGDLVAKSQCLLHLGLYQEDHSLAINFGINSMDVPWR